MGEMCVNCGKPTGNPSFLVCTMRCGLEISRKLDDQLPLTGKEDSLWFKFQKNPPQSPFCKGGSKASGE